MKIQKVQTINNKTTFNAHFINDKNGYFRTLWDREEGANTKIFKSYLDKFTNNNTGHAIEITELDIDALNTYGKLTHAKLFNHKTGESEYFSFSGFAKYHPIRMLMKFLTSKNIIESDFYSTNNNITKIYNQLIDSTK